MPSPNPTVRRQHSGNATPTTLSAPIVNGSDTSFTITSNTGWPDGSVGNFVVTINAGQSDAEKILCTTRSGTTVNVATRGYDSTSAAGHAAGATVTHTISAAEIDEANAHTNATTGVHGAAGSVVGTSDTQTLTNKNISDAGSSIGGVAANLFGSAWSSYTPTVVGVWSAGNAAITGTYKLIGKTLTFRAKIATGTTTSGTGNITSISLPGGMTLAADAHVTGYTGKAGVSLWAVQGTGTAGGSTFTVIAVDGTSTGGTGTTVNIVGVGSYVEIFGTVEVA